MTREDAIRRIKAWNLDSDDMEVLSVVIPELRESEDERIRKFLVKHVSEWIGCIEHDLKLSSKDVESEEELAMFKAGLAYLEKQKERGMPDSTGLIELWGEEKEILREKDFRGDGWRLAQNGGAMLIPDKSYEMGRRDERFEMMKDAVECEVYDFSSSLESHPHISIPLDNKKYSCGDKVKAIIVMEDEK